MFPLLESIRISNYKAENLDYHQRRLNHSVWELWQEKAPDLHALLNGLQIPGPGVFKCRILFQPGDVKVEFSPYTLRAIHTLQCIDAGDLEYRFKFADRSGIERLFQQRGDCDDILILKDGQITDSSYANVALLKGSRWFTPSNPLLNGTRRQMLLDTGILTEAEIRIEDLPDYEKIRLVNAMMPWGEGPEINMKRVQM